MGFKDVLDYFFGEGLVIWQAPVPFFTTLIIISGFIYWMVRREFARINANLESKLRLSKAKNEDYRTKLDGASPEEARARIAELERRVDEALHDPRLLTQEQCDKMTAVLRSKPKGAIVLSKTVGSTGCDGLHSQLKTMFRQLGWSVKSRGTLDGDETPGGGLLVVSRSSELPSADEVSLIAALTAADVKHELSQARAAERHLQIVLTDTDV